MNGPRRSPPVAVVLAAVLGAGSCSVFHQDLPNVPPMVQLTEADTTQVKRGGRVSLRVGASDEDDDPLTYLWQAEAGTFTDSTGNVTDWIAPNQIEGSSETFLLTVDIQDGDLETEDPRESFEIEVVQRPPVWRSVPESRTITTRDTLDLGARAIDPEGDDLTYLWRFRAGTPTWADYTGVRLLDAAEQELAMVLSLGVGVHEADEEGAAWIRQHRSAAEEDSSGVRFTPLAAGRHEIEIAVTDAIEAPSDTVSARFTLVVEAAGSP